MLPPLKHPLLFYPCRSTAMPMLRQPPINTSKLCQLSKLYPPSTPSYTRSRLCQLSKLSTLCQPHPIANSMQPSNSQSQCLPSCNNKYSEVSMLTLLHCWIRHYLLMLHELLPDSTMHNSPRTSLPQSPHFLHGCRPGTFT